MTLVIKKQELLDKKDFFISEMKFGKLFIYPTDTIYGIGCDATNKVSINKIKQIKYRETKPFSIIVPSFDWIKKVCNISFDKLLKIRSFLPGAYTLILLKKNSTNTLGIRLPNHYFSDLVEKAGIPFITTSVNLSGDLPATKFSNIPKSIYDRVDYIIDDDLLVSGKQSTIINMVGDCEIVIRK